MATYYVPSLGPSITMSEEREAWATRAGMKAENLPFNDLEKAKAYADRIQYIVPQVWYQSIRSAQRVACHNVRCINVGEVVGKQLRQTKRRYRNGSVDDVLDRLNASVTVRVY